MRSVTAVAGFGLVLALFGGVSTVAAKEEVCRAELNKFCKDVQPGEGRVVACMKQHEAELSPKCKAYLNTISQYTACLEDAVRLCPGLPPSGSRAMQCLRVHRSDISSDCKNELDKFQR